MDLNGNLLTCCGKTYLRGGPLMIGGLGQKRGKKLNGYSPGKKNSTVGWPGKKTQCEFSAQAPPPRSLMVRPYGSFFHGLLVWPLL